MPTIAPPTPDRLRAMAQELIALADLIAHPAEHSNVNAPPAPIDIPPEPQWVAEWRRSWRFLKAFEDAGGSLPPKEVSLVALRVGYSSPAAVNGFYRGNGAALRRAGDRRALTEAGRKFLREWDSHFGPGALYESN